jgi:tetratricopeptide (TPR) repeat protein
MELTTIVLLAASSQLRDTDGFHTEYTKILAELAKGAKASAATLANQKLDALILSDFNAAITLLEIAGAKEYQGDDCSEQRRRLLEEARKLFIVSRERFTNLERLREAGDCSAHIAGIFLAMGKLELAKQWYATAYADYCKFLSEGKEPKKPATTWVLDVTASLFLLPVIFSEMIKEGSTMNAANNLYDGVEEALIGYQRALKQFEAQKEEVRIVIVQIRTIRASLE